jgi:uncharacterized lipoprotein YmbA
MTLRSVLGLWCLVLLTGCGSGPAPHIYVLSAPAIPIGDVRLESGRPTLELKPVSLPDYLDTSDLLIRNGRNELTVSATARWGERLSIGVTHALAAALVSRLPGMTVVTTPVYRQPARVIRVEIDAFDVMPDGRCILVARWVVDGPDRSAPQISERGSVTTTVTGGLTDAAIVAAMAEAVEKLGPVVN